MCPLTESPFCLYLCVRITMSQWTVWKITDGSWETNFTELHHMAWGHFLIFSKGDVTEGTEISVYLVCKYSVTSQGKKMGKEWSQLLMAASSWLYSRKAAWSPSAASSFIQQDLCVWMHCLFYFGAKRLKTSMLSYLKCFFWCVLMKFRLEVS